MKPRISPSLSLLGVWAVGLASLTGFAFPPLAASAQEVAVVSSSGPDGQKPLGPTSASSIPANVLTEVVQRNCVSCHNDALLTGNVSLQHFSVAEAAKDAETSERMIRKLRAGMMPPPGMPSAQGDTLRVLAETLEATVDEASRAGGPSLGVRRFQRLTQAEYERAIRDMLALDVDAGRWLPPDILVGSFDNASAGQRLSTTLVSSFVRAATEISRIAVGNPNAVAKAREYANPAEVSQHSWDRLEGAPFGTRGGIVVTHDFPADGEYVFRVETNFGEGTPVYLDQDIDVSVAGEPTALLKLPVPGEAGIYDEASTMTSEPVFVPAGQHTVSAAFVRRIDGPYEDRLKPPQWSRANLRGSGVGAGVTVLPHVAKLQIEGPTRRPAGVAETKSRKEIFICRPATEEDARPCANDILKGLATRAFRRPVTDEDMVGIMQFYDQAAREEGFEVGVRTGLQAILSSAEFLFRFEQAPEDVHEGYYRLSDVDLASRLSFFLWATGPDEQLLEVAASGQLSDPSVLDDQVERMLDDPRAEALATRFAHQWLRLQDVGAEVWPEPFFYPDFSQQVAGDMVRETEIFFDHLFRENRSLLEVFNADYTFLNERLANHYGIDGVAGEEFRRVEYQTDHRVGIFGHGSVLVLTSLPNRTSPVERGKWVMEVLMGTPPPPPPPNVPPLEQTEGAAEGRLLTTRERMEKHRANPVCESCHSFIDPIGLALDNFDVAGKWRTRENMVPLDTRGEFYTGAQISKPSELSEVLLERPTPLVRNFTERLLEYAIGRPTEYFDQPTVRAIEKSAAANDFRMKSFILGVVRSDPFQLRQTRATTDD